MHALMYLGEILMMNFRRVAVFAFLLSMLAGCAGTPSQQSDNDGGEVTTKPDVTLTNTYWKLMSLAGEQVTVGEGQREPSILLRRDNQWVSGYSGCNVLKGNYQQDEQQLSFEQMATTMMACPDMETERTFLDALNATASWKVQGERLELFDASGRRLATFEARYF